MAHEKTEVSVFPLVIVNSFSRVRKNLPNPILMEIFEHEIVETIP